jgi:hypothetical protein
VAAGALAAAPQPEPLFILYVREMARSAVTTVAGIRASELRASSNPLFQRARRRLLEAPLPAAVGTDVALPSSMDNVIMHGLYSVGGRYVLGFVRMQTAAANSTDGTDAWAGQPRCDVFLYDFSAAAVRVLRGQAFSELLQFAAEEKTVHFTLVYAAKCALAAAAGYAPATSRGGTPWKLGVRPASSPVPATVLRLFPGHWLRGLGSLDRARGFVDPTEGSSRMAPRASSAAGGGVVLSVAPRAQSAPHVPRRLASRADLADPRAVAETLEAVSLMAVAVEERAFVDAAEVFPVGEIGRRALQLEDGEVVQCIMRVVLPADGDVGRERANGSREPLYHLRLASTRTGVVIDRYVTAAYLRVPLAKPLELVRQDAADAAAADAGAAAGAELLAGGNPFADVPAFLGCVDMPVQAEEQLLACRLADGAVVQRFAGRSDTGSLAAAARHPLGPHPSVRIGGAYLVSLWVRLSRNGDVMMPSFRLRCQYLLQPLPVLADAAAPTDAASGERAGAAASLRRVSSPPEVVRWVSAAAGWADVAGSTDAAAATPAPTAARAPAIPTGALRVQAMLSEPVYEYEVLLADLARADLNPFLER